MFFLSFFYTVHTCDYINERGTLADEGGTREDRRVLFLRHLAIKTHLHSTVRPSIRPLVVVVCNGTDWERERDRVIAIDAHCRISEMGISFCFSRCFFFVVFCLLLFRCNSTRAGNGSIWRRRKLRRGHFSPTRNIYEPTVF